MLGGVTYVPAVLAGRRVHRGRRRRHPLLAVAPSARRRGVGEALTVACIERAQAAGRRHVLLPPPISWPTPTASTSGWGSARPLARLGG